MPSTSSNNNMFINTKNSKTFNSDVAELNVGILTSYKQKNNSIIPKGKQARLLKEMIKYGFDKGLTVFFFSPEGFNWKRKVIKGYSIDKDGKWITRIYSYPPIIYNRIQYRSLETKSNVQLLLQRLANDPEVFIFNSRFLNKWEVYEALHSFEIGQHFIPETKKFNRENLRNMLKNFPEVFLKPTNSSRGQGIVKIISQNNSYKYARADANNNVWNSCSTFNYLSEALSRVGVKENRYLIQQGIDLATYNDRVFDLRTQAQKDGQGKWIMTGVAARVAGKDKFVTHIPNGGKSVAFEEVIKNNFGTISPVRQSIEQQLKTICTIIPPQLEMELGLNLAILSFDIGIDQEGHLWILEINSKPASFDEDDIRHRHLHYLTDYFIFAAQKIAKRDDY